MASHRMRNTLKRSALAVAMGMCFVAGVQAQTNTAGAVAGRAASGDTITVTNPATGFSRTITVGSDGSYRFSQLPTGQYTITRNGGATRTVNVSVGTSANVDFVGGRSASDSLDTVTVVGANVVNPIDVSSVESTTIMTAEQIKKLPVATNATAVALLAPGTVRGDAAFGNLASFGGASVAENQYYLNGFSITNSFRSLAYAQVPYEAIAEQQIKTGGYGAEFGRSTGGVINMISKRGTNEFKAGGNVFWTPEQLTENEHDVYLQNGTLRQDNSGDSQWNARANLWAGGPLVRDKLFGFALISYDKTVTETYGNVQARTNSSDTTTAPNWLVKLDWEINDSNRLEFTSFSDIRNSETDVYENRQGMIERGAFKGTDFEERGGRNYILKYTGYLTDNFTLSALAGYGEYSRSSKLRYPNGTEVTYNGDLNSRPGGCPIIVDIRNELHKAQVGRGTYASSCNLSGANINRIDSGDTRKQFRVDAEWRLGSHIFKGGVDIDNYTSIAGTAPEGGSVWRYSTLDPDRSLSPLPGSGIAPRLSGDEREVARQQVTAQGSTVEVKQRAFYVEDSWNITDNLMAYLGARWDSFENLNGQGETYVDIKNQFAPRLGLSWDVYGDSTFKVFANAGRYALPLTPSVAVRGASSSLFTRQQYFFTGVDPVTGAPIGATPRPGSTGRLTYVNGEDGHPKNPATIAATNLEPMYQDEFIVGMQKAITDNFSLGVRAIHRDLKQAIDDNCDYSPVYNRAVADGMSPVIPSSGFPYCRMFNPGSDMVFLTDVENNGTLTSYTIPAAELGPKAKRKYSALEFFFDGNWDRFFLQGSYTYAKSFGNTEGGVKSDIGQADTSVTQDFDYKELMVDSAGYLPNDRRHSLKLFGNFDLTDEWSIGANMLVQSGRPMNCLGTLPWPAYSAAIGGTNLHPYGASFFRCNNVARPRGTVGRLPWTNQFDLSVGYNPLWAKGLQIKVDIFNIFNSRKVTSVSEVAEDGGTAVVLGQPGAPLDTYLMPTSFQAPRSVRFMVQYEF